ncbi:DUF1109 domain-containing protein [Beijerinckiaceae bacterium]|nr:DUF1109 domain-containing protein [Beijerinckiaceae bacterium]
MKTNELIRALAADSTVRRMPLRSIFAAALVPGFALATALFFVTLGPRPHLLELLAEPRFLFKLCVTVLLVVLSAKLVLRLVQPGRDPRRVAILLAIVPLSLAAANLAELIVVPAHLWGQRLIGTNAVVCLISIPFLGLAPLAAALFALRRGAPDRPALAGAGAGLFAGAIGAALYATHCPDDSPLFVTTWYTLAIAFVAGLGALAGSRLLRW